MFVLCIYGISMSTFAAQCENICDQISGDVNHFSSSLSSQHLTWMNLAWLEKQLGKPAKTNSTQSQMQYKWQCKETDSYISLIVNSNATLVRIDGACNSAAGSSIFSGNLIPGLEPAPEIAMPTPAVQTTLPQQSQVTNKNNYKYLSPEKFAACQQAISQISADISKYPYVKGDKNSLRQQHLPWMSITGLEHLVGPNLSPPADPGHTQTYIGKCGMNGKVEAGVEVGFFGKQDLVYVIGASSVTNRNGFSWPMKNKK